MEKVCLLHNKPVAAFCMHQGCTNVFLCLTCHRTHPEDHEDETELFNLPAIEKKVQECEKQKEDLITKCKDSHTLKDTTIVKYKDLLKKTIDGVIEQLENKLE